MSFKITQEIVDEAIKNNACKNCINNLLNRLKENYYEKIK